MFIFNIWRVVYYSVKAIVNFANNFICELVQSAVVAHQATLGILVPII